jgi:serine phosphatase RsbU (regulator of sigma subunit)
MKEGAMLAAITVPGMPVSIVAIEWLAACLLGALIGWALLLFFLRRRLGTLQASYGPLFAAVLAATFGAAALSMAGRAFALYAPFVAAPAQILFLIWYYLYPDVRYLHTENRNPVTRIRWLSVFYFFSQISGYWPQKPSQAAAVLPHLPGLLGTLATLGNTFSLAPVLVGVLLQLYGRARRLAVAGSSVAPQSTTRLALSISGVGALALLGAGALTATPAAPAPLALDLVRAAYFVVATLVPVGVGLALMNGRRYDREALLRRAANGSALAACLLAVYVAGVATVRVLVPDLSGPGEYFLPFVLPLGMLLAALYRPLRSLVEAFIAQRWFPETYEAGQVLAKGLGAWGGGSHPDRLAARLVAEVEGAVRPAALALWLRAPSVGALRAVDTPALAEANTTPATTAAADVEPAGLPPGAPLLRRVHTAGGPDAAAGSITLRADDPARATLERATRVMAVERLPEDSETAHLLRAAGLLLALPLVSAGQLEGLMALAARPESPIGEGSDVRELLEAVASAAAPTLAAARIAHEQEVEARLRERVEQELRTARRIQESLLPKVLPALEGWHIATCYQPAREVGGDFYDFIELGDGSLGIVIGDVTDKGIPAALVMATTRSMLRAVAVQPAVSPGNVLAQVNALLCADLPPSMFVTCFYAILDPATGRLRYANAGQDLPYLRRADGSVGELHARGMPLGLMPEMAYEEADTALALGDAVLFYSDGLVEAHNPAREMFGFPRLKSLLGEDASLASPITYLLRELADFTQPDWEQEDDITLVALHRPR